MLRSHVLLVDRRVARRARRLRHTTLARGDHRMVRAMALGAGHLRHRIVHARVLDAGQPHGAAAELAHDRRIQRRMALRARRRVLLARGHVRPQPRRRRTQSPDVVVDRPQLGLRHHLIRERRHDPPRIPHLPQERVEIQLGPRQRRTHAAVAAGPVTAQAPPGRVQPLARPRVLRSAPGRDAEGKDRDQKGGKDRERDSRRAASSGHRPSLSVVPGQGCWSPDPPACRRAC